MFDVGFWEVSLILVVMLIVIGPERLPGVLRKVGLWLGKARRMVAEVKVEVDRELQLEELKQSINRQTHLDELKQLARDVRNVDADIREQTRTVESDIRSSWETSLDANEELEDKLPHPSRPQHSGENAEDSNRGNLPRKTSTENTEKGQGNMTDAPSPTASKPPPNHSKPPTH